MRPPYTIAQWHQWPAGSQIQGNGQRMGKRTCGLTRNIIQAHKLIISSNNPLPMRKNHQKKPGFSLSHSTPQVHFDDIWVIDFSNNCAQVVLQFSTKQIVFSIATRNTSEPCPSQPSKDAYQHMNLIWGGRNQISIAFAQKQAAVVKCTCTPFEMHPFLPKMSSGIIPILEQM